MLELFDLIIDFDDLFRGFAWCSQRFQLFVVQFVDSLFIQLYF
jgi:hypothetical protein